MDKAKAIDIIMVEWLAWLKNTKRGGEYVKPNFERLFDKWKSVGATFDDLYEAYLPRAVKAHYPASHMARQHFKNLKAIPTFNKTEKEFIEEWHSSIESKATEMFFDMFPPPIAENDGEPKMYGNMSASEYRAQRKYAEQFPVLDTTELEKRWKEQQYNLDIEDMLKNVLGADDGKTDT